MAVEYITRSREFYSAKGMPAYQWSSFEDAPFAALKMPLSECRIGVLSSSGVFLRGQEPFNPDRNDFTFREIPRQLAPADIVINHNSYDHTDALRDINCVIPLKALDFLEREGVVKEVAGPIVTFMGRITSRLKLVNEMAPAVFERFRAMKVDAVFMIPV